MTWLKNQIANFPQGSPLKQKKHKLDTEGSDKITQQRPAETTADALREVGDYTREIKTPIKHTSTALAGAKKHNEKHANKPDWVHKERNLGKNIKKGLEETKKFVGKGKEKVVGTIETIKN
ncbi:MAG TPA: hypothetical protein EYG07_03280 [Alphaproteobacteria bacterium]|jgi:hypothetical protein|nr:hypothetical protein [Alphaproteobacteria bacterium]